MTTYVVVHEDYTPQIFKSIRALAKSHSEHFHEDGQPVTEASLSKALKERGSVRLCREVDEAWSDKVFAL